MSERLKWLGRRQELELEKKRLEISIAGLIHNLREALDPLADIEELDPQKIATWTADLDTSRNRYRAVLNDLKKIKEMIG
jgi:hypothetical protein